MSKKSGQKATRQHPPTKIIVERHYVGTVKVEFNSRTEFPRSALAFCPSSPCGKLSDIYLWATCVGPSGM